VSHSVFRQRHFAPHSAGTAAILNGTGISTRGPALIFVKPLATLIATALVALAALPTLRSADEPAKNMSDKITKTDAEWKQQLTPEQYRVLRKAGTERPGSSPLNNVHERGVFKCVACDKELYSSDAKFESGTGWPSFFQPIAKDAVDTKVDKSLFSTRTEVLCQRCGGHLGHVFEDGPKPTGLRYCMNGVAMKFEKQP
jgi:peptide-methionine (R)-S-oxide reductase